MEILTDHSNLHAFMSTNNLTRRQVWRAFDLSAFDFRFVYCKGTINPSDGSSRQPDYQKDAELEDSMTDNTSVFRRTLFSKLAAVTSQPMSPTEKKTGQILVIGTYDWRSLNERRQARGDVSNKSIYVDVSNSLIDNLTQFLRAGPLAKKVTRQ